MRINLQCMQCNESVSYATDWLNDGTALTECRNGHRVRNTILAERYEILSETAVNAIIDGYYRESVTSFTSSLERFFESYIEIIYQSKGLDSSYEKAWGNMKTSSERQLGAYIFTYLNEESEIPMLLSRKRVEFRNEVIHKGRIPTIKEAICYGQAVVDIVRSGKSKLEATKQNALNERSARRKSEARNLRIDGEICATFSCSSVYSQRQIGMPANTSAHLSLEEWIDIVRRARSSFRVAVPVYKNQND